MWSVYAFASSCFWVGGLDLGIKQLRANVSFRVEPAGALPASASMRLEADVLLSVFFSSSKPEARYRHSAVIDPTARAMYLPAALAGGLRV